MIINCNPAPGMRDLSINEVELRSHVTSTIVSTYKKFGFSQIETPCLENINLLSTGEGGDNEKMLFKILKRGDKLNFSMASKEGDLVDLGLRYDLTVPLSRYFANNRTKLPQNFKVIQVGSVWRAERPQKGRFRQFTQCDIDIIGVGSVVAEMELILATAEALLKLGFANFKVRINDRRILLSLVNYCLFDELSHGKVFIILDKLDKIGIGGVRKELEEAAFNPDSVDKFVDIVSMSLGAKFTLDSIRSIVPNIPSNVLDDLDLVIRTVSGQANEKFSIELDISLVRGMGYYTGQIFEVEVDGYKSSIAGGGRYDKMIGKLLQGKEEIPACGFSIGFERVISILQDRKFEAPKSPKIAVIYPDGLASFDHILDEIRLLRDSGKIVSMETQKKNVRNQLDVFAEAGFTSFAIYTAGDALSIKSLRSD